MHEEYYKCITSHQSKRKKTPRILSILTSQLVLILSMPASLTYMHM